MMLRGENFFFNKVVREVLSEEINVIKELRHSDEMSHTGIHLVGSWWIKAIHQTPLGKGTVIFWSKSVMWRPSLRRKIQSCCSGSFIRCRVVTCHAGACCGFTYTQVFITLFLNFPSRLFFLSRSALTAQLGLPKMVDSAFKLIRL